MSRFADTRREDAVPRLEGIWVKEDSTDKGTPGRGDIAVNPRSDAVLESSRRLFSLRRTADQIGLLMHVLQCSAPPSYALKLQVVSHCSRSYFPPRTEDCTTSRTCLYAADRIEARAHHH